MYKDLSAYLAVYLDFFDNQIYSRISSASQVTIMNYSYILNDFEYGLETSLRKFDKKHLNEFDMIHGSRLL